MWPSTAVITIRQTRQAMRRSAGSPISRDSSSTTASSARRRDRRKDRLRRRVFLGEITIEPFRHFLLHGVTLVLRHGGESNAEALELFDLLLRLLQSGGTLFRRRFGRGLIEGGFEVVRYFRERALSDESAHRAEQMFGQEAGFRDLVQLQRKARSRIMFESVDHAGLKGRIEFVHGDRRWNRAHDLERLDKGRRRQYAKFDVLQVGEARDRLFRVDASGAEMKSPADNLYSCTIGQYLIERFSRLRVHRPRDMVVTVEHIAEIEHADLRRDCRPNRRAGDHHVGRADLDLLYDVGLLAELAIWKIVEADALADRGFDARREFREPEIVSGVFVDRIGGGDAQGDGLLRLNWPPQGWRRQDRRRGREQMATRDPGDFHELLRFGIFVWSAPRTRLRGRRVVKFSRASCEPRSVDRRRRSSARPRRYRARADRRAASDRRRNLRRGGSARPTAHRRAPSRQPDARRRPE